MICVMDRVLRIFNLSEYVLCDQITTRCPNELDQIYLMPEYIKRMGRPTIVSVSDFVEYLLTFLLKPPRVPSWS